jgi:hypothetical protein
VRGPDQDEQTEASVPLSSYYLWIIAILVIPPSTGPEARDLIDYWYVYILQLHCRYWHLFFVYLPYKVWFAFFFFFFFFFWKHPRTESCFSQVGRYGSWLSIPSPETDTVLFLKSHPEPPDSDIRIICPTPAAPSESGTTHLRNNFICTCPCSHPHANMHVLYKLLVFWFGPAGILGKAAAAVERLI